MSLCGHHKSSAFASKSYGLHNILHELGPTIIQIKLYLVYEMGNILNITYYKEEEKTKSYITQL